MHGEWDRTTMTDDSKFTTRFVVDKLPSVCPFTVLTICRHWIGKQAAGGLFVLLWGMV